MAGTGSDNLSKLKLIISMIIFGTIGIFVRYIPLPSSIIAMTRGIIGTLFLLIIALTSKSRVSLRAIKKNFVLLMLSGAAVGFNWIFLFEAYKYTTVATATLCYYLAPVFVIALSPVILKEKLTLLKGLCVIAALIGMAFVSGIFQVNSSDAFNFRGIMFGMAAAFLYSSIIIMNKFLKDIASFDSSIVQLGIALVTLIPYTLMTENFSGITLTTPIVLLLGIVGIVHTGVAYYLYFSSLKDLKGQTIAIFSYIDPVVAIILSAMMLKESLGVLDIVGAVLILGSTLASEANH